MGDNDAGAANKKSALTLDFFETVSLEHVMFSVQSTISLQFPDLFIP